MELWDIILIIGVILIANGIFTTQHAYITTLVDSKARENKRRDIVYGAGGGLLAVTNNQVWIETDKAGNMGIVRGVRSGLFQIAKAFEFDLSGHNIKTFEPAMLEIPKCAVKPCMVAKRNFMKAYEFDRKRKNR